MRRLVEAACRPVRGADSCSSTLEEVGRGKKVGAYILSALHS